jgi:hypothetical protein
MMICRRHVETLVSLVTEAGRYFHAIQAMGFRVR